MSDHEAALSFGWRASVSSGQVEVSPVHHPVVPPIPELFQTPNDGGHVSSGVGLEDAGRVLEDHPLGTSFCQEPLVLSDAPDELEVVVTSGPSEPEPLGSGDRCVLTGETGCPDLRASRLAKISCGDVTDVSKQLDGGVAALQDRLAVRVPLDLGHDLDLVGGLEP